METSCNAMILVLVPFFRSSIHSFMIFACLEPQTVDIPKTMELEYQTHSKSGLQISILENYFLYFSSKTYVVGTQKNHLNETFFLSTKNTCLN